LLLLDIMMPLMTNAFADCFDAMSDTALRADELLRAREIDRCRVHAARTRCAL